MVVFDSDEEGKDPAKGTGKENYDKSYTENYRSKSS